MKRIIFTIAALAGAASVMLAAAPDTVWTARHKHENNTRLELIASCLDNQGRVFFCGTIHDAPYTDIYVLKVDPKTNDTLWCGSFRTASLQLTWASDCVCDSAGNLFVVGATTPVANMDMLVVKFDGETGGIAWSKILNSSGDTSSCATACDVDKYGFLYVAGTKTFMLRQTAELIKLDPSTGDTIWTSRINDADNVMNEPVSCMADSSGYVFVIADNDSAVYSRYRIRVSKHNATSGDTLWTRQYDWEMGPGGGALDLRGYIYFSGSSSGLGTRTFKFRTDNGDTIWNSFIADAHLAYDDNRIRGNISRDSDYIFSTITQNFTETWLNLIKLRHATGDTAWLRSYRIDPFNPKIVNCMVAPEDTVIVAMRSSRSTYYQNPWMFDYSNVCIHVIFSCDTGEKLRMHAYEIKRDFQEQGLSCLADRSGNLYQVGYYDAAKNVVKATANDGMTEWEMRYFFYNPQHVISNTSWKGGSCVDAEGYVYVTGEMINSPPFFTLKLNPATGDTIWADKHYDWRGDACCVDDSGHLFVVGRGASIIKYDALTGARIAQQTNTLFSDTLYDCVSSRGLLFAVGFHEDFFGKSAFVLKNLNTGAMDSVWTRTYDLIENVHAIKCYGCALSKDSSLCLAGEAVTNDGFDYLLEKIDTLSGNVRWERSYGGPAHGMDIAYDCAVDSSGNIYVTGASGNGNDFDYLTVCYTPSGDTLWSKRYDGPDHRNDIARGIAIDSLGYLYVTGSSQNACNYDMVTVKYGSVYAGVAGNARAAAGPGRFKAFRSAPNPFRQRSQISFTLPAATAVDVRVYNAAGQLVRTLQQGQLLAGAHSVPWDGRDNAGRAAAAGIYLYRIAAGTDHAVGKMVLVR